MQGNDSFKLVVRRGPQPGHTYDLNKDIHTLGRDITNDIVINDPEVSRHHLRIKRTPNGYSIEDLGSTNGTFVGGQRITGTRDLNRGDMIGLGETVTLGYEVIRAGGAAEAADAPASYSPPAVPGPAAPVQPGYGPSPAQPPSYDQPAGSYGQPATPPPSYDQPGGYGQPATPPPSYDQPGGYGQPQPAYGQAPEYATPYAPPPGTAYDPYDVREDDGNNTLRWVLIGCAVLTLFCCCSSLVGIVVIDALSLWYDLPIIRDLAPIFEAIAEALGLI